MHTDVLELHISNTHDHWVTRKYWLKPKTRITVCAAGLLEFFHIPDTVETICIEISNKQCTQSYEFIIGKYSHVILINENNQECHRFIYSEFYSWLQQYAGKYIRVLY